MVPGPPLRLTGDAAEDRQRVRQWRRTYSPTMWEPLSPREETLDRLRRKRDALNGVIRLQESFAWHTAKRLAAVGIRV
jgi:hypothetical protein